MNLPDECPSCHEHSLSRLGVGTERIEEELQKYLPAARVLRMDIDTTSKKGSHKKMITAFQNHEYDILLGTQIVAKGLDFENVTLVGIINADTSLNIPDFRSSETTFSLLSQVSGRAGRSKKEGKVYLQTFNPTHYAIALEYKMDTMEAPVVLAKGVDNIALRIKAIAEEHDIPIVENPPLARALFASAELDQTIPPEHYKAVAEVIGYVMQLKK